MHDELTSAIGGAGPLLQRDYWAVLEGCRLAPVDVMALVKEHFCELPPASLVAFVATDGLDLEAELDIRIKPMQDCRVRVTHCDAQSLTLATLGGHPEAGRITFGAYRNPAGDIVFHIRSRARSSSAGTFLGFTAIGEAMQTNTWTGFIQNTALALGARVRDAIHADTTRVEEGPDDALPLSRPTFAAVGD